MPFKPVQVEGGWKVQDDKGKFYSGKPLSRKGALAQMRALYAAGAAKKEAPDAPELPVDAVTASKEAAPSGTASSPAAQVGRPGPTPTGTNPHGPGGLAASPGLSARRWGKRKPASTKAKKAGKPGRDFDPNVGGGVDRGEIPDEDFAGKNRSFPIVEPGDVQDAAQSIGRARNNYPPAVLKRNIIKIARCKGEAFVKQLPAAWNEKQTLKHGSHDQKAHGHRFGMQGLREVAGKAGLSVRTMSDGKIGLFGKKGDKTNMRARNITEAKKLIRSHTQFRRRVDRDLQRARTSAQAAVSGKNNLHILGQGEKKPKALAKVGNQKVTGSGVFKKNGQSFGYYTTKRDGRTLFTFDKGKTWSSSQMDAFISAAGGYEKAHVILGTGKPGKVTRSRKEFTPEEALAVLLEEDAPVTLKHLPGKHDQAEHARGRKGGAPAAKPAGAPASGLSNQLRQPKGGAKPAAAGLRKPGDRPARRPQESPAGKPVPVRGKKPKVTGKIPPIPESSKPHLPKKQSPVEAVKGKIDSRLNEGKAIQKRMAENAKLMRGGNLEERHRALETWKKDYARVQSINRELKGLYQERKRLSRQPGFLGRLFGRKELEGAGLTVFKDKNNQYRWVLYSSNAFRDRDGEIVSTRALEDDVERTDELKEAGPLRWWHVPGYELGNCDFRMVSGRTLIESGTFKSAEIGEHVKEHAGDLQVSIGFRHPNSEPDRDKVFHTIYTFERSLLPAGRAANPFTKVFVEEPMATKEEKLKVLAALGIDPKDILSQAAATEKELDSQGVAFKEQPEGDQPDETDTPAGELAEAEKAKKPAKKAPPKESDEDPEEEAAETPEEEDTEEEEGDEEYLEADPVIGDMPVEEFKALLADHEDSIVEKCMKAFEPAMKAMHTHDGEEEKKTRKKELDEAQAAMIQAAQAAAKEAAQPAEAERARLKEVLDNQQKALEALNAALTDTQKALKEANARLAELEGETPRALSQGGFSASQSDATEISEERAKELGSPHATQQQNEMFNFLFGGTPVMPGTTGTGQ